MDQKKKRNKKQMEDKSKTKHFMMIFIMIINSLLSVSLVSLGCYLITIGLLASNIILFPIGVFTLSGGVILYSIFNYKINQIEELIGDIINKRKKKMGYYILGVVILTFGTALIGVSVVIYIIYNIGMI